MTPAANAEEDAKAEIGRSSPAVSSDGPNADTPESTGTTPTLSANTTPNTFDVRPTSTSYPRAFWQSPTSETLDFDES